MDETSLYFKNEVLHGLSKIFFKIKNASQNVSANFFVSGVLLRNVIFKVLPIGDYG
jgi:hypothetical protein